MTSRYRPEVYLKYPWISSLFLYIKSMLLYSIRKRDNGQSWWCIVNKLYNPRIIYSTQTFHIICCRVSLRPEAPQGTAPLCGLSPRGKPLSYIPA